MIEDVWRVATSWALGIINLGGGDDGGDKASIIIVGIPMLKVLPVEFG